MKKVQSNWVDVKDALNARLKEWNQGCMPLKNGANIDYFAARRVLMYGVRNQTEVARKLCTFFCLEIKESANKQGPSLKDLTKLLGDTWDGSTPHAELLSSLIKSTKPFRVQERDS